MNDLFKAELRRFLPWAGLYAAVHQAVLMFLTRVADLAQQPDEVYLAFAAVYALSGLLLGLYQMGGYRRPNAWLNLLHRPLPPWRIALALLGAGAALLALAVWLPLLATAAWQESMTPRVLDLRHWLLCVAALMLALAGYATGSAAILLPRRAALAPLAFLLLLPAAYATGAGALGLQALVLAWLVALVLAAFKPDVERLPGGAGAWLLAVPMQVMMWLLLVLAGFGAELLWIAQGTHPNNLASAPAGSAKQADNAEGADLIFAGLANSVHPDAPLWREQAAISDIATFGVSIPKSPAWHELSNRAPMEFDDEARRIRWVFSHDLGKFVGYGLADRQRVGELGVDGDARFPSPPLPVDGGLLAGRDTLHQFDAETQRVLPRVQLPAGEFLTAVRHDGERLVVMSQRALYFHDARPMQQRAGLLTDGLRMPLPGPTGNLQRVDVMELLDGYLVSFTLTRLRHNGRGDSFQQLIKVDEAGAVTDVARRELATGYGPLFTWQTWWLSPAISSTLQGLRPMLAAPQAEALVAPPPRPALVIGLALGLLLLSLALGAWRVRRTALSPRARLAWCVACAVVGLPALMALWRLAPAREDLALPVRGVAGQVS
ncbi:hypothetical protein [Arenimonas metalli]|uniref:Uncharacterized protein n=1 Tax=Arenimonas metalli CF5-1 TaxID=1384056 RepID=A0A091B5K8_9GAMM|nr:hypothetical protein [Arenimonas metalli]KFN46144.1 hypothetical protein N787_11300 [Arenimonas metalli CF5-1]